LETPDVTLVQKLIGLLTAVIVAGFGVAKAFGVDITPEESAALLGLWTALGAVFVLGDAIIRNGRAKHLAGMVSVDKPAVSAPTHKARTRRVSA
jgi:membrane associated rhomboid family serine protease